MQLKNSTDWPDWFLRRLVAWCCRNSGLPVKHIKRAQFRNRGTRSYSGHAWVSGRIVVSVGPDDRFPTQPDSRDGMAGEAFADRVEALVAVTAHEVEHICQYREGRSRLLDRRRASEAAARRQEIRALRSFRAQRETLIAAWSLAPKRRQPATQPSRRERNEANARKLLAAWQRKLRLAKTKLAGYERKVRRHDRARMQAAATGPPTASS